MNGIPSSPLPIQAPTTEEIEGKQAVKARVGRLLSLIESSDFAWFLAECVQPAIEKARSDALNSRLQQDDRNIAVHLHERLTEMSEWTNAQFEMARDTLKSMDA